MSETRQRWLRQMMGLGPAPDPVGLRLVDGKVRWLSEAQREIELAAWHREGRGARVAAGLAYLPQRVDRRRRRVQDRAEALVAERALARARTLRYRSRHLHPIGETQDIEGYFDLGRARYRLDVVTPGLFSVAAEQDWRRGAVLRAAESPWCGADTLLVPADTPRRPADRRGHRTLVPQALRAAARPLVAARGAAARHRGGACLGAPRQARSLGFPRRRCSGESFVIRACARAGRAIATSPDRPRAGA